MIDTCVARPGISAPLGSSEQTTGSEVAEGLGLGLGNTRVATLAALTLTDEARSGELAALGQSSSAVVSVCMEAPPIMRMTSVLPIPEAVTLLSRVG